MVNEGIVLGHKISSKGIEIDKAKIDAIEKLPYPHDIKGIRSFPGHAGFYRCFIKIFSSISKPLTNLLQKNVPFMFNDECKSAFEKLKHALLNAPIITPPDWDMPYEVICKTDDNAVSAVLGQQVGEKFNVIYLASHTLTDAQRNYAKNDRELYGVIFACENFRLISLIQRLYSILTAKQLKRCWMLKKLSLTG